MGGKSLFGPIAAIVAVLYCAGLVGYFFYVGGSLEGATSIGLGPTLLGLTFVGLLFCIPLIVKLFRTFRGPRAPGSGGGLSEPSDSDSGFDADAVVARYLAQKSAEAAANAPASAPTRSVGVAAKQTGFGRRSR